MGCFGLLRATSTKPLIAKADRTPVHAKTSGIRLCGSTGRCQIPRGVNFSVADTARATSGPDDFDFLIGLWHFRFQQRNGDGSFNPPFNGHWFFERKRAPGAMIVDHWRGDNPATSMDSGTWTYRTYNAERKIWNLQGVNTPARAWLPGLMWSDGANRYLIQHYGAVLMRFRYFDIEPNRFLWRADATTDGGQTWLLDRWTMEVTRIGK